MLVDSLREDGMIVPLARLFRHSLQPVSSYHNLNSELATKLAYDVEEYFKELKELRKDSNDSYYPYFNYLFYIENLQYEIFPSCDDTIEEKLACGFYRLSFDNFYNNEEPIVLDVTFSSIYASIDNTGLKFKEERSDVLPVGIYLVRLVSGDLRSDGLIKPFLVEVKNIGDRNYYRLVDNTEVINERLFQEDDD